MGAAAGVEIQKPTDASDIAETGDLEIAKGEVMRLRDLLGQYARDAGFSEVIYDASDLVLGFDTEEDFERCINEIVHIRTACRMATQKSRRQTRVQVQPMHHDYDEKNCDDDDEDSDNNSDDSDC